MTPQDAIDLCRDALVITLLITAPALVVGMAVGLTIGLLQALTQVQEQTIAFVPKLVAMVAVLILTLPWAMQQLIDYFQQLMLELPNTL